jgi:uncharacterized FAD-dependent dehydrogenase
VSPTSPDLHRCDVLVAGAGPAGLFAALSLVAAGKKNVTIIDAGPDVDDRRRASDLSRDVGWGHPDYERGVGGAGLFSDGKLCLSLEVGGHLEQSLADDQRADLLAQIEAVFCGLIAGPLTEREIDARSLGRLTEQATENGMRFKYYPVAHIGTDRCGDVIARLRDVLAGAGVTFLPRTELIDLAWNARTGEKIASVRGENGLEEIRAKQVVLAMGKVGARRQAQLCRELGSEIKSQPIYVGVRFETRADLLEKLFAATKDPKYSLNLPDGSRVKTHCASEHGEVIPLHYSGLPLAGGHNYFDAKTSRSGFSILWDGLDHGGDSYGAAEEIMRRAERLGNGQLIAQRLLDYRQGHPSRNEDLSPLDLSCPTAAAGDLRAVLPAEFFPAMEQLLERLEAVVPGFVDETAVAYAPAIEWWMERVDVDDRFMMSAVPGVASCGDGSGWSQGIVHAAATGLLAAAGLHEKRIDVAAWMGRVGLEPTTLRLRVSCSTN